MRIYHHDRQIDWEQNIIYLIFVKFDVDQLTLNIPLPELFNSKKRTPNAHALYTTELRNTSRLTSYQFELYV